MTTKIMELKPADLKAIALLLNYSWVDVFFTYEQLTDKERNCISKTRFARVNKWRKQFLDSTTSSKARRTLRGIKTP